MLTKAQSVCHSVKTTKSPGYFVSSQHSQPSHFALRPLHGTDIARLASHHAVDLVCGYAWPHGRMRLIQHLPREPAGRAQPLYLLRHSHRHCAPASPLTLLSTFAAGTDSGRCRACVSCTGSNKPAHLFAAVCSPARWWASPSPHNPAT